MMTANLFVIDNVNQLRTGGSFRILLPFFRISWGVGVLNSAIFNSFHNRVEFGKILEDLRNFRGGGLNTPTPTSVRHWSTHTLLVFMSKHGYGSRSNVSGYDDIPLSFHVIPRRQPSPLLTYILTYLLTYSMVQSPSWEANWFAASQEILRISRNPKVHYALTSVRHLSLPSSSPIQSIYPHPTSWRSILILSTHLRLGLPSPRFPHQDPINPPLLTHTSHIPSQSHSSRFYHPHNIGWGVQII